MARASWGSTTGDFSGLFAGLLDEQRRRIEQSVEEDIRRSKEQQSAEDNDMYDKWQNGIINDREWLDYVESRVKDSRGDPTEHAEWTKTLREHRSAIRDAQLEQRYEDGDLSIHKLIAHYSDKLGGVEKNSPAYRDSSDRYYQLIDERDSYYIEDEANRILNRIQRGQAGYGELRDFYAGMLKKVRRSSPLYRQLKENLQSISDIGAATGGSGGSGGGGGSSSGGSGGGDGSKDPYSVASRAVYKMWKSGNVFVPGGKSVAQSVIDAYNIDTRDESNVWYALAEDSVVIEQLMEQAADNPDAKYLITPWGQQIPNDLRHRQLLMNQGLRGYDYRIALGHAEGRSVLSVYSARDSFVETTFQPQNDARADDYWKQIRQNFWERVETASQNPDPNAALTEYIEAGKVLDKGARAILGEKLQRPEDPARGRIGGRALEGVNQDQPEPPSSKYSKTTLFPEEQVSPEMREELDYAKSIAAFVGKAKSLSPEELATEASILFDDRPESFFLTTDQLEDVIGTNKISVDPTGFDSSPQVGTGLIGKSYANRGLQVNEQYLGTGENFGLDPYVYVGRPGVANPLAVPAPSINSVLGVNDWQDGSTRGGWEKVGQKTVWVVRPLEDVPPPEWYKNDKGQWLTAQQYDNFGRDFNAISAAGYSSAPIPEFVGWQKITDGNGDTWYKDPQDGFFYKDFPPFSGAAGLTGPIFDYAHFVKPDGSLDVEGTRVPASTGRGFVAWFSDGVSPREAQTLTEGLMENPYAANLLNPGFFHKRDDKNHVSTEALSPDDVVGMYWSEHDQAAADAFDNVWGHFNDFYSGRAERESRNAALQSRAEMRRKAEVQSWIDQRFENRKQQLLFEKINSGVNIEDVAASQIAQAKAAAGITLGNERFATKEREAMDAPRLRPAAPPTPRPIAPVPVKPPTIRSVRPRPSADRGYTGRESGFTERLLNG